MAWEIGPYYLEAGQSARYGFTWGGQYRGIQLVQAKPEVRGAGSGVSVIGGPVDLAVTEQSMVFDPSTRAYTYQVDVTARDGDWYQFRLRGQRVD
jgi:hypothetical protein